MLKVNENSSETTRWRDLATTNEPCWPQRSPTPIVRTLLDVFRHHHNVKLLRLAQIHMDRRQFLRTLRASTTVGIAALAGCAGGGGGGGGEGGQKTAQTTTATATPTPTATTTQTTTASTETTSTTTQSTTGAETETDTQSATSGSTTVAMVSEGEDYYFDPIGLFVKSGTTVTWEIDSGSHSSTAYKKGTGAATVTRIPNGAQAWDSGILSEEGATFEHTFDTPGTYDYFCTPHKTLGMVARLVVGAPGGPAERSMPPDGKVPSSQMIVEQGSVPYDTFSGSGSK